MASFYGDVQLVRYYMKCGANIDLVDNKGNPALLYAKDNFIRKELLSLHQAVLTNDRGKVQYLLNNGFKIDSKRTISQMTPLREVV